MCSGGACSGVPAPGGGIPACTEADTPPPWTEFLTHATSVTGGNKRIAAKGVKIYCHFHSVAIPN